MVESGRIVVAARSGYCRVAVALMHGTNVSGQLEELIHSRGRPDLTFYLKLPPATAVDRVERRNIDRESLDTLAGLEAGLDQLAPKFGWIQIDASQPPAMVHNDIVGHVEKFNATVR